MDFINDNGLIKYSLSKLESCLNRDVFWLLRECQDAIKTKLVYSEDYIEKNINSENKDIYNVIKKYVALHKFLKIIEKCVTARNAAGVAVNGFAYTRTTHSRGPEWPMYAVPGGAKP